MKILYVHHGRILGGAPISLLNTILAVKSNTDYDLKLLCVFPEMKEFYTNNTGISVGSICNPGLTLGKVLIGWANPFDRRTFKLLIRDLWNVVRSVRHQSSLIKSEKPDIIHLNSSVLFTTAVAGFLSGVPVIWHIREIVQGSKVNLRRWLVGVFIKKFGTRVITIGLAEAKSIGGQWDKNVCIIHNFVDFSKYDFSKYDSIKERKKLNIPVNERVVLSLGGLSWRKGALELIQSMRCIKHDKVRLIVLGVDGFDWIKNTTFIKRVKMLFEDLLILIRLKKFARWEYNMRLIDAWNEVKKNVNIHIQLEPSTNNVIPYLGACDVLITPYTFPHSARPVFEAWALKKPVIAFDIGGISENIRDGIDGFLIRKGDINQLGRNINSLLSSNELLKSIGLNGYNQAVEKFDKNKNIGEIVKIYEEVLSA